MKGVYLLLSQYQASVFIYSCEQATHEVFCKQVPLAANAYDFIIFYKIIEGIKTKPWSDLFFQTEKNRVLRALEWMPRNYLHNCKEQRLRYKELIHATVLFNCAVIIIFYSTPVFSLKFETTLNIQLLFAS